MYENNKTRDKTLKNLFPTLGEEINEDKPLRKLNFKTKKKKTGTKKLKNRFGYNFDEED